MNEDGVKKITGITFLNLITSINTRLPSLPDIGEEEMAMQSAPDQDLPEIFQLIVAQISNAISPSQTWLYQEIYQKNNLWL